MAWLADSTIQQVKHYPDIVGMISDYIDLKRRGRNYIGLCPFHSEKTPSFTVSPEKGIFHCFGCHESGDLITFVTKIDNLTFAETIEKIAERAGITVEHDTSNASNASNAFKSPQDDALKESVRDILYQTRIQFSTLLHLPSTALQYLKRRGLTDETIKQFHLGYAAPEFNLLKWSQDQKFTLEHLKKTGLFFQTENGALVSRFKNRIVFPILDYMDRTLGFGGRVFEIDQRGAKYVNSEESIVFNKRHILYGISLAKAAIKKQNFTILVEGYMDVLMCHQYGIKNVVAIMGTALTIEQIQKLKRFSSSVTVCLDNDTSGQTAIERSCELLLHNQFHVKVMQLENKDPADFLLAQGADLFQTCIDTALSMIDFMLLRACQKWDSTIIENIPKIIDFIVPYLRSEKEAIIQRHYVQRIATELNIEPELIMAKIRNLRYNFRDGYSLIKSVKKSKRQKAEEFLVVFSAVDLKLREQIFKVISPDQFLDPLLSKLACKLVQSGDVNALLLDSVEDSALKKHLTQLILSADALNLATPLGEECNDYIQLIHSDEKENRVIEIKNQLKLLDDKGDKGDKDDKGDKGNDEQITRLLQELHQLRTL